MTNQKYFLVGKLGKPHSLKGFQYINIEYFFRNFDLREITLQIDGVNFEGGTAEKAESLMKDLAQQYENLGFEEVDAPDLKTQPQIEPAAMAAAKMQKVIHDQLEETSAIICWARISIGLSGISIKSSSPRITLRIKAEHSTKSSRVKGNKIPLINFNSNIAYLYSFIFIALQPLIRLNRIFMFKIHIGRNYDKVLDQFTTN